MSETNSGIVLVPFRRSDEHPYTRTTYTLTDPWYSAMLPPKLDIMAGRAGLDTVIARTRHNLAPRIYSALVIEAILTLVRDAHNDAWVSSVQLKHPRNEHPTITVLYRADAYVTDDTIGMRHEFVFAALRAFIETLTGAPA